MVNTTLTKPELRHFFREDPAFLWFKEIMLEQHSERKLLTGASTAEDLFIIKGISRILRHIEDPEILIELLDIPDE